MDKIQFLKIRDVKSPNRGTEVSSGIDFYIPNDITRDNIMFTPLNSPCFHKSKMLDGVIYVHPGEGVKIPTGIKVIIEPGFDMTFENKSGVSIKNQFIVGAKVIDSDYRGEINIHLINTSLDTKKMVLGEKVVQGIVRKVELDNPVEITELDFESQSNTERGEGGFGSTGTM